MRRYAIEFVDLFLCIGEEELLRGVSGKVEAGRIVVLIGPSGAGKSTLMSVCNLMRSPTAGSVYVEGREVRDWPVRKLRQKVGMVFQSPTIFPGTVEENLAYGLKLHGQSLHDPRSLLHDIGLEADLLSRPGAELSGGQKQRVALGRTLAMKPDILLLDEVTSALDVHAKLEVERTILRLHEQRHTSMLWVTHDLEQARRVADVVWFMAEGRLVETATADSFFAHPETLQAQRFMQTMAEGETR
ncbi:phosphate ABC transporter ATP-binding protein [Alicyclobacillus fastidiosus]|uniref:Phosphate ABC transporter ATP-binding protein n=1 Tax=Alicyclobacillus fastidiosus TaxID=392011 RepID=A0ABY6ZG69_9BACL|nr:phosphate ABC transporter ATP-binding protein [Alicyclobacillus fastidiosus]WAH41903.1 phosphate ABC transporter ATP-binding protein [Alicyclobacillus fastidiosus]GMA63615.1 putative ABC transporter ATP-binding protein YjkB [Alicyclobacillus fastidiosus]